MKKISYVIAIVLLGACKKETASLQPPSAAFTVAGDTTGGTIIMGTYDQYLLTNTSTNAVAWHWDFGNDSSSNALTPILSYPLSGSYTLTLTEKNGDSVARTVTRSVKVLDRFMKQVQITGFNPNYMPVGHSLAHAHLWAVIRLGQTGISYPIPNADNQSLNTPIIYQTPVVTADSTQLPYTFTIPGNIKVDYPALLNYDTGNLSVSGLSNVGYGLELYAQDSTGTYLLSSSYQFYYVSGSGAIKWPIADIQRNIFVMLYANVQVICDYE